MKLGINLAYKDPCALVDCARLASSYGFDWVGVVDSPMLFCDTAVASTLVAVNTDGCRVGPVVTNPVSRRVEVIASQLASLHELSGGRAALGIGSGDTAVANMGLRPAPVAVVEKSIERFRSLTEEIPVVIAAGGPKMTDLAARVGDGVMLGCGVEPGVVGERLAQLRSAAASAGRDVAEIEVWTMGLVHFPGERAEAELRSLLAAFAHHSLSDDRRVRELSRAYRADDHLSTRSANHALVEQLGLTDSLAATYLLPAEPAAIAERLDVLEEMGVGGVMLSGTVPQRRAIVEFFGTRVLPGPASRTPR